MNKEDWKRFNKLRWNLTRAPTEELLRMMDEWEIDAKTGYRMSKQEGQQE